MVDTGARVETRWPQCTRLQIEWSGFEAWPGTLRCVLEEDF